MYIIHWQAVDWCTEAVTSMLAGGSVTVVVVDNGGAPLGELRERLPSDVEIIEAGYNAGYAGGANLGLAHWRGTHPRATCAAFAAHDVTVRPGDLDALASAFTLDPKLGIVGPVLDAPFLSRGGTWNGVDAHQVHEPPIGDGLQYCDWVSGTLMVVRQQCADDVGCFDERLHSYSEDLDFALRARDNGWRVAVLGRAHASGKGSRDPATAFEAVVVNDWRVAWKRATGDRKLQGRVVAGMASSLVRSCVGSLAVWHPRQRRQRARRYVRAKARAVRQLRRNWSDEPSRGTSQ